MNMTFHEKQRAEQFRKERQLEHAEHLRQQEITAQNSRDENAALRAKYLAGLEAAKTAKQAESDAAIDQSLMPKKQQLMRQWLADHPDKNAADFDKLAWTYLRQNLVEQGEMDNQEAMRKSLLATGRYAL